MKQILLVFSFLFFTIIWAFLVYVLIRQLQQNIWTRRIKNDINKSLSREDLLDIEQQYIGKCISNDCNNPFDKTRGLIIDAKFVPDTNDTYIKYVYVDLDDHRFIEKVYNKTHTRILYDSDKSKLEEHKFKF